MIYARYAFNLDDGVMWLEILAKHPIINGYNPSAGRFYPLAFMDLNILMQFFTSAYVYCSFNAIEVFCVAIVLWKLLEAIFDTYQIAPHYKWIYIAILLGLLLHPGFVAVMLGICYPERLQVLFLLVFVYATFRFSLTNRVLYMTIGCITANLSLYLKEPTFLFIGFVGFVNLIILVKNKSFNRSFVYYTLLALSAMIYLILYMWLIYPHIVKTYDINKVISQTAYVTKGFANFVLQDCFIILLLPTLGIYRLYRIWHKKEKFHGIFDTLAFGSMLYILAFIKLQLFEAYYLIPVYIMSLAGIVYYVRVLKYMQNFFVKVLIFSCCIIFIVYTLPIGIHSFIRIKTDGIKFHQTLSFLAHEAKDSSTITLYFDGNGRSKAYNTWYWSHMARYLTEVYGVSNFDIKVKDNDYQNIPIIQQNLDSPLTIYNSQDVDEPQEGDFIILNNSTHHYADSQYLEAMTQKYDLVYKSQAFGMPYISIKSLTKYIFGDWLQQKLVVGDKNIFKLPTSDYIYRVKKKD
ncbi:hypothetical protein [Helicobacter equorum]|uniref:hypothetical protein n=1 Tax=Helicobacter equorum TaxID=361872 RepID=UPI0013153287|nr:hypothetical protein [Helicobacter equorum]